MTLILTLFLSLPGAVRQVDGQKMKWAVIFSKSISLQNMICSIQKDAFLLHRHTEMNRPNQVWHTNFHQIYTIWILFNLSIDYFNNNAVLRCWCAFVSQKVPLAKFRGTFVLHAGASSYSSKTANTISHLVLSVARQTPGRGKGWGRPIPLV